MLNKYGDKKCQLVLIHGGPGAKGSLHTLALQLSQYIGVGEQIQNYYTIEELLTELYDDIVQLNTKVCLLGHSWGAFLVGLFAAKYPNMVNSIILVGCPPLTNNYVSLINERRMQRLTVIEQQQFKTLLNQLEDSFYLNKDEALKQLGQLVEKADNYCINPIFDSPSNTDGRMYDAIWEEAIKMRQNNDWVRFFNQIQCPIYLLQGIYDPHPIVGVSEVLSNLTKIYEFKQSGHSPFLEKYDNQGFIDLVIKLSEPLHKK